MRWPPPWPATNGSVLAKHAHLIIHNKTTQPFSLYQLSSLFVLLKSPGGDIKTHQKLRFRPQRLWVSRSKEGPRSLYFSKLLDYPYGNQTWNHARHFLGVSLNAATVSCLCLCPARPSALIRVPAIAFCQNPIYSGRFFPNPTLSLKALFAGGDLSFLRTFIGLYSFFSWDLYSDTFCTVVIWVFAYVQGQKLLVAAGWSVVSHLGQVLGGM